MGMGYMMSPSFDYGIYKAIVCKAKEEFQATIESWNEPLLQTKLVGHTIEYKYFPYTTTLKVENHHDIDDNGKLVLKHHGIGPPFRMLDQVADLLMNDERFWGNDSKGILMPEALKRTFLVNTMHILGCIVIDLLFSTSVTIHSGLFEMKWTFHPELINNNFLILKLQNNEDIITKLLDQIDFIEIEKQATQAAEEYGTDYPGESSLYSMCFKLMLIMFLILTVDAESRAVGGSVRMELKKPENTSTIASSTTQNDDAATNNTPGITTEKINEKE